MSSGISSWADAADDVPGTVVTANSDGTKTVISYRNNEGKLEKITQIIKEVKVTEKVHPLVAQRRKWVKYGKERNTPAGPDTRTTQLGEKIELKLGSAWKEQEKEEEALRAQEAASVVSDQRIKCRSCGGAHFTSKCPYKDTLGPATPAEAVGGAGTPEDDGASGNGKYVPRHMRRDANGNLPLKDMSRDDACTLKVTQLNSIVDESMLRSELFAKYAPLARVTVVRNKETGESRGIAYVTFATESLAERALEELNGKGYYSLILRLEWSKKKKT